MVSILQLPQRKMWFPREGGALLPDSREKSPANSQTKTMLGLWGIAMSIYTWELVLFTLAIWFVLSATWFLYLENVKLQKRYDRLRKKRIKLQVATTPWVGMLLKQLFNAREDDLREILKLDPKAKMDEEKEDLDLKGLE